MLLRPFLNDSTSCASYLFGCATHGKLAVVDPHAELVDDYPRAAGQLVTGWISDHIGRKPLIVGGMLVQAAALAMLVAGGGAFAPSLAAALVLGAGTAMVYPTLIAAVSDVTQPRDRARVIGVYRFWRDFGFVAGAIVAGIAADAASPRAAIVIVTVLTATSGLLVASTSWQARHALLPAVMR